MSTAFLVISRRLRLRHLSAQPAQALTESDMHMSTKDIFDPAQALGRSVPVRIDPLLLYADTSKSEPAWAGYCL